MPSNFHPPASPEKPPVVFHCGGCGLALSICSELAGTSGPCPNCGAWITSPGSLDTAVTPSAPELPTSAATSEHPLRIPQRGNVSTPQRRAKGRIPADSIVDYARLEQRESAKTLLVLALFVLVVCGCLAVAWFLKQWLVK